MNKVYRNLEKIAPHLVDEWDSERNGENHYKNFWNSREDPAHWICVKKKHRWQMRWDARVDLGQNCPYCSGKRPIKGETDLQTRFPEISKDWCISLNEKTPQDYLPYSHSRVWWNCTVGIHEPYSQMISKRTGRGTGCPKCSIGRGSSKGEFELGEFLKSLGLEYTQNSRKIIYPMELDFYLPKLSIAIEYNGEWMHSNKALKKNSKDKSFRDYHLRKQGLAKAKGIDLVFVWEHDWEQHRDDVYEALIKYIAEKQPAKILSRLESYKDINKNCCTVRV